MRFNLAIALMLGGAGTAFARIAPIVTPGQGHKVIPDEYIVVLRNKEPHAESHEAHRATVSTHVNKVFGDGPARNNRLIHTYTGDVLGYAAIMDPAMIQEIQQDEEVDYIEHNQVVKASDIQYNPENWGIDRVDQRNLPLDEMYHHGSDAGEGVDVYIVDTGINIDHVDFEGRAVWGLTAPWGDEDADGNGHGSHVASSVAGKDFGVAKKAKLIAVKVLRSSGYGTTADVLKGIEYVGQEHMKKKRTHPNVKSVANMSLGGGKSPALEMAVDTVVGRGVHFAVAAGNENEDACNSSPAAARAAVTVGASTKEDVRAWFSNWGQCVDIFAPGHLITGAWIGGSTSNRTISGTSMASPHVAGVLAKLAGERKPMTGAEMKDLLLSLATPDKIADTMGSPNLLLYAGDDVEEEQSNERTQSARQSGRQRQEQNNGQWGQVVDTLRFNAQPNREL